MEQHLIEIYKQIFSQKRDLPEWAVHKISAENNNDLIHCTIPFVGKDYFNQKTKILLYASAENLSKYHLNNTPYLDDDEFAVNRHRRFFDDSLRNPYLFYPNVHIQPITDGGLALVAYYIFCQLNGFQGFMPTEFLEMICFANYCKYTISGIYSSSGKQNTDYASHREYLSYSHNYIKTDFQLLRPDYVIIPKTIYETDRDFIDSIKRNAKIIPIYQINAKNINMRIKAYPAANEDDLFPLIKEWWYHLNDGILKGKTQRNFLSVFTYIDYVLSKYINIR